MINVSINSSQVWYSADGRLDMKGIMQSVPRKEITRFNIWMVENMSRTLQQESERTGKKVIQQMTVLDMAGKSNSYKKFHYHLRILIDPCQN